MIKLEHVVLPSAGQMRFVIEGMRNPYNSWDKTDSNYAPIISAECDYIKFKIGNNDTDLMKRLSKAGTDHRKFMRMMPVMVRITAPLYWWKEFSTYKVGTVANSTSTMHKIAAKKFTLEDFSTDHLLPESIKMLESVIDGLCGLNYWRNAYLEEKTEENWWQMIQLLPSSYNQTRNVLLNYEVLANIYKSRKNHKLTEWREFCEWIEKLPYSEIIIGGNDD